MAEDDDSKEDAVDQDETDVTTKVPTMKRAAQNLISNSEFFIDIWNLFLGMATMNNSTKDTMDHTTVDRETEMKKMKRWLNISLSLNLFKY